MRSEPGHERWSSRLAFHLAAIGAAVGLGSIWRFPYLVGANGGAVFLLAFILACLLIATPLLVAEFLIGRRARKSPPEAAGEFAAGCGRARAWNVIGVLGSVAALLIMSYYTVIAGWVMAYAWKCASGELAGLTRLDAGQHFHEFLSNPWRVGAWHLAFLALLALISGRGVHRGIELANRIRAPALLTLLLILVVYSLATGDVRHGLTFAFAPDFSKLSATVLLTAVGQAFYATGVGMAMMLAYGSYVGRDTSLVRSALAITGSIVLVSILGTMIVFPLVFQYGLSPAQGPELVFDVLPTAFAEMPGGRFVGTLFFLLLILAALTPSIAGIEPLVAWLQQRAGLPRVRAACVAVFSVWVLGSASVLSFNVLAQWHPLAVIARFRTMTLFDVIDFASANVLLPVGALLTCVLIGWRIPRAFLDGELSSESPRLIRTWHFLIRVACPLAIAAILLAALM